MANHDTNQQWLDTAERLRAVKEAGSLFLDLWALSRLAGAAPGIERMAADVGHPDASAIEGNSSRDWSFLYRGSILDD